MSMGLRTRDWEATFQSWGQPPSQTERDKCENAERGIRSAIAASDELAEHSIEVRAQGSYKNRTNVRQSSDVDICVLCTDVMFTDRPPGVTLEDVGLVPSNYTYQRFKNDVGKALTDHFGDPHVNRGDKAFDVHANTYRVDADVVACFQHRRFEKFANGSIGRHDGTELWTDSMRRIINWPRQNYDNGVVKNGETQRRFKAVVRILKRLRNEMDAKGIAEAGPACSFLIECLVYNVPDNLFATDTLTIDVRNSLAHLWNETRWDTHCDDWWEINELKYLFNNGQPWSRWQANSFLQTAWDYIGFENE